MRKLIILVIVASLSALLVIASPGVIAGGGTDTSMGGGTDTSMGGGTDTSMGGGTGHSLIPLGGGTDTHM